MQKKRPRRTSKRDFYGISQIVTQNDMIKLYSVFG